MAGKLFAVYKPVYVVPNGVAAESSVHMSLSSTSDHIISTLYAPVSYARYTILDCQTAFLLKKIPVWLRRLPHVWSCFLVISSEGLSWFEYFVSTPNYRKEHDWQLVLTIVLFEIMSKQLNTET